MPPEYRSFGWPSSLSARQHKWTRPNCAILILPQKEKNLLAQRTLVPAMSSRLHRDFSFGGRISIADPLEHIAFRGWPLLDASETLPRFHSSLLLASRDGRRQETGIRTPGLRRDLSLRADSADEHGGVHFCPPHSRNQAVRRPCALYAILDG